MKKLLPILAALFLTLSLFGCKTVDNYLKKEKLWEPNSEAVSEDVLEETTSEEESAESSVVKATAAGAVTNAKTKPVLGQEWSIGAGGSEDNGPIRVIQFLNLPASFDNNAEPGGNAPAATVLSCEMNKNGSIKVIIRKDSGHTSTFRVTYNFLDANGGIVTSGVLSVDYTVGTNGTTEQVIREVDIPERAVSLEFTGVTSQI